MPTEPTIDELRKQIGRLRGRVDSVHRLEDAIDLCHELRKMTLILDSRLGNPDHQKASGVDREAQKAGLAAAQGALDSLLSDDSRTDQMDIRLRKVCVVLEQSSARLAEWEA